LTPAVHFVAAQAVLSHLPAEHSPAVQVFSEQVSIEHFSAAPFAVEQVPAVQSSVEHFAAAHFDVEQVDVAHFSVPHFSGEQVFSAQASVEHVDATGSPANDFVAVKVSWPPEEVRQTPTAHFRPWQTSSEQRAPLHSPAGQSCPLACSVAHCVVPQAPVAQTASGQQSSSDAVVHDWSAHFSASQTWPAHAATGHEFSLH